MLTAHAGSPMSHGLTSEPPRSLSEGRWWERAVAVTRPALKKDGQTLGDIIEGLDELHELGFDAVEVFAPCEGGLAYGGLDALDFCRIDPAIGTMADFLRLVAAAHARGIAVIPFLNLGYVHEQYPAFLRACDDMARGATTDDTRLFLWSEDGAGQLEPPADEFFLQGSDGRWCWSERAGTYFWVKWEGENGGLALPQLNWADPGWQRQAGEIIDFWRATGADGIVVDAVNWYIGSDWQIIRRTISDRGPDTFLHPEGAGGFADDPVAWVADGAFTVIMDYGLKIWWDDLDVIRDAVTTGDHRPLESSLRAFRDRVDASGGTCLINPPRMSSAPAAHQRLAAAVVATVGELFFDAFGVTTMSADYRSTVREMLHLRAAHPALTARGPRVQVPCTHESVYAFVRGSGDARVVVALNFSDAAASGVCSIPTLGRDDEAIAVSLDAYDVVVVPMPEPHSRP